MAEGHQNTTDNRIKLRNIVLRLTNLIVNDSFDEIKEMMETLPPDHCTKILSSTIDGCTVLSVALRQKNIKISNYLFQISSRQEHHERFEGWNKGFHPVIFAMTAGSIEIMYLISRNIWDINDYISGPYTPLLYAVKSMDIRFVRLILLLGADINKPCLNGSSPLIVSIFSSKMCSFLLAQNANINHQDDDGNTALHFAAEKKQSGCAKILINAEADVRIRNKDKMTPLMVASININFQTVLDLCELSEYSQIEKIEALEVLGACLVGCGFPYISYWFQALEMRNPRFPKILDIPTQEVLDFSREFTTKKELKRLQADHLKLAFQGILVIDRILGRNNFVYLQLLMQTILIAEAKKRLKVQQLIDYTLQYCQETAAHIISQCWYFFKIIFTELFSNAKPDNIFENGAFGFFKIIARATVEMWLSVKDKFYESPYAEHPYYTQLADTFLYIAENIWNMDLTKDYQGHFIAVMVQLVKEDPRFIHHHSLLHHVVRSTGTETWGSVELIRLLLESGADIDSKDSFRRTPLMYALVYGPDDRIREILELLMEYKCHLDCRDIEGFSAMDIPRWASLSFLPRSPLSLQCLAVGVILDCQIEYESLPKGRKEFIDLHK